MDLTQAVDIYCERTDASFWSEPLNAATNIFFIAAACAAAYTAHRTGRREIDLWVLITLAALIGIGSFLFHTFATVWAGLADTLPIWTFVAFFVFVAIRRIGGVNPGKLTAIFLAVAAVLVIVLLASTDGSAPEIAEPKPDPLNGSGQYAPALLALLIFSVVSWRKASPMAPWVSAATITFLASLTFRIFDMHGCEINPLGTHFLWHTLNGLMIGLLLQGLIRTIAAQEPRATQTSQA